MFYKLLQISTKCCFFTFLLQNATLYKVFLHFFFYIVIVILLIYRMLNGL